MALPTARRDTFVRETLDEYSYEYELALSSYYVIIGAEDIGADLRRSILNFFFLSIPTIDIDSSFMQGLITSSSKSD